eukprot:Gb_24797 [translate_table: standard]
METTSTTATDEMEMALAVTYEDEDSLRCDEMRSQLLSLRESKDVRFENEAGMGKEKELPSRWSLDRGIRASLNDGLRLSNSPHQEQDAPILSYYLSTYPSLASPTEEKMVEVLQLCQCAQLRRDAKTIEEIVAEIQVLQPPNDNWERFVWQKKPCYNGTLNNALTKLQSNKKLRILREAAKSLTKQIGGKMHEIASKVDEYARGIINRSRFMLTWSGVVNVFKFDGLNFTANICESFCPLVEVLNNPRGILKMRNSVRGAIAYNKVQWHIGEFS